MKLLWERRKPMGIKDSIKGFLKMTGHYAGSAMFLAENGYCDKYIEMLRGELETAEKASDIAQGQALLAQGLMFKGEVKKSLGEYEKVDIDRLGRDEGAAFVGNYALCLFLLDRPQRIRQLLIDRNREAFGGGTLIMRRTVGIREYTQKRYENAVTVFLKLLSEPDPRVTLMADICLVKTMLKLDMRERAKEIAEMGFDRYRGLGEITTEVGKLRIAMNSPKGVRKNTGKKKKK
ncbi:MAG: hypothetical protein K2K57_06230 [Oscillospiraceae bacterium]|nr:hypothetical protein [Oscillospiraceae bacterium]